MDILLILLALITFPALKADIQYLFTKTDNDTRIASYGTNGYKTIQDSKNNQEY